MRSQNRTSQRLLRREVRSGSVLAESSEAHKYVLWAKCELSGAYARKWALKWGCANTVELSVVQ